jgi:LysR family transcriptional regulator, transcriptional activator of nhaA
MTSRTVDAGDGSPQPWLNYHHLFHFWTVAREGGISRAAAKLHITHSTLSTQVTALAEALGAPLFERRGRGLALTPFGSEVRARADEIFRAGHELLDLARGQDTSRRPLFRVGVIAAVPRTVAWQLLSPAMVGEARSTVRVVHDRLEPLLDALATGRLHLVLSDRPPPQGGALRLHAHRLGESGVALYGTQRLARRWKPLFPARFDGAPLLLPVEGIALRRDIDRWLAERDLSVSVEGEFDDAGLLRTFGLGGAGLFPVREALAAEVEGFAGVSRVALLAGVTETYYAITAQRRARHPSSIAVVEAGPTQFKSIRRKIARPIARR